MPAPGSDAVTSGSPSRSSIRTTTACGSSPPAGSFS
jgi:hypothetical protein